MEYTKKPISLAAFAGAILSNNANASIAVGSRHFNAAADGHSEAFDAEGFQVGECFLAISQKMQSEKGAASMQMFKDALAKPLEYGVFTSIDGQRFILGYRNEANSLTIRESGSLADLLK